MIAFSMKFLVTIDSVYSLKLISRDIFLAIWIVLFSLLGFYLMGKIRFAHDSDLKHIGTFRFLLIIIVFSFVVYLIPGLFGSPLKGLATFLPSQSSTELNLKNAVPGPVSQGFSVPDSPFTSSTCSEPRYGDIFDMPYGLPGYFEYKQGLACAKEQGKPVLLDFKGHACANCKLMEAKVWSDPEILKRLRSEFVIVALYVDDRTPCPRVNGSLLQSMARLRRQSGK